MSAAWYHVREATLSPMHDKCLHKLLHANSETHIRLMMVPLRSPLVYTLVQPAVLWPSSAAGQCVAIRDTLMMSSS